MNPTLQKTLCFDKIRPDTVNRARTQRLDASGKGINVSRVLSQLGKNVVHLTQLGGQLRELFLGLCRGDNLDVRWVESGSEIRFCYTLVTGKENGDTEAVTELVEEGAPVAPGTEQALLETFREIIGGRSTLVISGTKAAGFSDALVPEMVRIARERHVRIILDVRGKDLVNSLPWEPDVCKPNLFEFCQTFAPEFGHLGELLGTEKGVRERVREIALELAEKHRTTMLLSRGTRPLWYTDRGKFLEEAITPVKALNPIGSGDSFTAGLAAGLDDALPLNEAIRCGMRCGALNAGLLRVGSIV